MNCVSDCLALRAPLRDYVGSSMHVVKMHVLEHKSRIKNNIVEAPLVSHFQSMQHSHEQMKFCVLYTVHLSPILTTGLIYTDCFFKKNQFFIFHLNLETPYGLNQNNDFSSYI